MMHLPESWNSAIFERKSRRSFHPRLPEEDKIARLETVCREFRPFSGARAEFIRQSPQSVFRGIIGSYGRISGSPLYIALIGCPEPSNAEEKIGYTGEGIILEAIALGLATCWVSGFFRREGVREHIALANQERVFAVTPIGYAEERYSFKEKLYRGFAGSRKRKSLPEIADGLEAAAPWQAKALEAARIAPSAANRQPWHFIVGMSSITIRTDNPKDSNRFPKRLDCGIAMLHLELGARAMGVSGKWTLLPPPDVARFEINQ